MLRLLARELLLLVVPPLCAACREPELSGAPLCPPCRSRLVPLAEPRCRRCGAPAPGAPRACPECRGRGLAFEAAWSPFAYDGVCRAAVAALKSRAAMPLAGLMAREIASRAPSPLLSGALVPVPAHARRSRRHGFNQAAAIAAGLAREAALPVRHLLVRSADAAQVGLERPARIENARGSVRLVNGVETPKVVVLVDDVYTTGATLDACARVLLESGAERVVAVTFARALLRRGAGKGNGRGVAWRDQSLSSQGGC